MIGKLVTISLGGFLLVQQQSIIARQIRGLQSTASRIATVLDMDSFASALRQEQQIAAVEDRVYEYPTDLSEWINQHFSAKGSRLPGIDRWGNPYLLEISESGNRLLCCGPDSSCGTVDDIVKRLTQH